MSQNLRTASGGRIDRAKPISFTFDGQSYQGFKGDTLASALLANGVHLTGRSFKYHRPRGIVGAGSDEPNALADVSRGGGRSAPNLRMTQVELYEGLSAASQNRWPSLAFDVSEINNFLSPLFAAGFYYKTFMGPRFLPKAWAWNKIFEPVIRHSAGLGKAPSDADPDRYANRYEHCDVLVIGGGPAGLMAALAAAENGAKVILCDEQAEIGGSLLTETTATIEGRVAREWALDVLLSIAMHDRIRLLPRTTAFGYYAQNFVGLVERITDHLQSPSEASPRERMWQVRAKQVVLATGAIERPLVFPDNDRPGIMLADAARTYLNRYGVLPGKQIVLFTATDDAYRAAIELKAAGAGVPLIADLRPEGGAMTQPARDAGIRVELGACVTGTEGRLRISAVKLGRPDVTGVAATTETVACDCLLMSAGWTPSVHLFSQSRGKLAYDEQTKSFVPGKSAQAERSAGACKGTFTLAGTLNEGYAAGVEAAVAAGYASRGDKSFHAEGDVALSAGFSGATPHDQNPYKAKAFVDFQNDVTAKDIRLATREGMRSIEHIKRFTTTGMATDQGKTSNLNALAIAADALQTPVPKVGLTTFRQPYTPTTFGTFAGLSRGDLFDPVRRTPIHDWAAEQGAAFEDVGIWKRAYYFPKNGEDMHAAVKRECRIVRQSAGVFDASTLGKIEVVGPDAAEFMNRLYTNAWSKLEPGRCRYGVMLNEAGFVMDDGVIGRIAPDRFHVTTTTGGAPRVLHHMEDYLQTEFPELKVWLTSTTEQWAVIAVQGPSARKIVEPLIDDIDVAAMPHMSVREGHIKGVPTRLFRVSFTGELGFEVNVPADYGRKVWELIWAEAQKYDAVAYGTETMHVLRAEKGYIIVGQETDGTMVCDDVGLAWAVGKTKPDFVGKRGMMRSDLVAKNRKQMVGLFTSNPNVVLEEGAQITAEANPPTGTSALGHVTSSYWSETLQRSIALAVVANGRARMGETLHVPMPGGAIAVTLTDPIFFDKEGKRLDG
ncbi:sarcosine oxidase subunit alpha family protein [Methylovirgula sp. 4M-Z18]|uniref:sarcosine oxidase subunit alpha family protein n=1 Tax=Methylovirgula sp. 4M-Z18 TaxID=2293567 RepID=UPI000E2FD512|nr:sarcosine oxidase subunit alpha family protein [Methylovirgula sp. 4M-Z18]RFB78790.1 sarcosine oxidase subunit alpha family protein [Methylovirgula sp. 4M-Z18]